MIQCVIKYIKQVCDYHEKKRSGKRKNVIKDALDYVNRNLYNPELSLKKVASDLYINDSYLSREFKKTYGVSFLLASILFREIYSIKLTPYVFLNSLLR